MRFEDEDEVAGAAGALRARLREASTGLVEREHVVELTALAAVAREHLLVLGPPGTAKSDAVRRASKALGGRHFEYLLGRFTEPSELFGPVDLKKLSEGSVQTRTDGMLPEAEVVFLDEVFLGSTAILNTLLGILNERVFRRGGTIVRCPLKVCVGAANALPEEPSLMAFADRFLLSTFVDPVPDPLLEELLERGASPEPLSEEPSALEADPVETLANAARAASMEAIRPDLALAIRSLRGAGVQLSDRRVVRTQRLIAAAAVLAGRGAPTRADLWPLVYAVGSIEGQALARDLLAELLAESESPSLPAAAEDASRGPLVRAARLREAAEGLLERGPGRNPDPWLRKLEGGRAGHRRDPRTRTPRRCAGGAA